jgi:hypothetical protein
MSFLAIANQLKVKTATLCHSSLDLTPTDQTARSVDLLVNNKENHPVSPMTASPTTNSPFKKASDDGAIVKKKPVAEPVERVLHFNLSPAPKAKAAGKKVFGEQSKVNG